MAKIYYSMSGEGRGHAARAAAIVDSFRLQHEITLFAPDQAYDFLAPRYEGRYSGVRVYPLPGLRFHYRHGRLALLKSIVKGVRFWTSLSDAVDPLCRNMRSQRPDLVITDFEPLLPRAAERVGVPYVSLDHQHFLTTFDLSTLPLGLRGWASLMQLAVLAHYSRQRSTIVTSFFDLPLRAGQDRTISVGPIVRRAVAEAAVEQGDYLVSYLRKHTPPRVVRALRKAPCEVRIYGLGKRPRKGNIRYCPFDSNRFIEDLAGCRAVVGAAGNQTLGEALFLGKPVLALPEDNHFEQRINAFYLEQQGCGQAIPISRFQDSHLTQFLRSLPRFRAAVHKVPRDGNQAALAAIHTHVDNKVSSLVA